MGVLIGLEILMPYTFYKGVLLTNEEYEKIKEELDQKEQEYLRLLMGEELESKDHHEASLAEAAEAFEDSEKPVDDQKDPPNAEGSGTAGSVESSEESEVRQVRRKRQR
jgi:hypothetical protein